MDDSASPVGLETSTRPALILQAAAKLFRAQGVAATTVRDIGNAVGMQSGSLYNYFTSKDQIVEQIIASYLKELLQRYRAIADADLAPREAFERMVRTSFDMMSTHRDACEVSQNDVRFLRNQPGLRYLRAVREEIEGLWLEVIVAGAKSGDFRSDIDPHLFHRFARDAMWFTVRWYRPDGLFTIDEIADQCLTILMDGYGRPPEAAPAKG